MGVTGRLIECTQLPSSVVDLWLLEGVLGLLTSAFEVGLRLVGLAPILNGSVTGEFAERFLNLPKKALALVLRLIRTAHGNFSFSPENRPAGRVGDIGVYLVGQSPNVKVVPLGSSRFIRLAVAVARVMVVRQQHWTER